MGRPYEGKDKTLWARAVKVYVPDQKELKAWNDRKRAAKFKSLSKFLLHCARLGAEQRPASRESEALEEANRKAQYWQEQAADYRERWDAYRRLLRIQDAQLRKARARSTPTPTPGRQTLDPAAFRLLLDRPSVQDREFFETLAIPKKSPEAVRLVHQLEVWERARVVERTGNGWRLLERPKPT